MIPGACLSGCSPVTGAGSFGDFHLWPFHAGWQAVRLSGASWLVSCSHPCGLLVFKREETELDDRCWILDGLKNCISGIKVEFCASIWLTFFFPQDPDAEAGGLRILSETWQLRKSYPKIAQTPKNKQTKQNPRQANSPFSWSPPCFSYPWAVNVSCRN